MPTKHTPGPWSRKHTGDGKRYIIGAGQSSWGTHVAEVYSDDTDADEAAANSLLIQAAPILLAALEEVERALTSSSRELLYSTRQEMDPCLSVIRDAIAAATKEAAP